MAAHVENILAAMSADVIPLSYVVVYGEMVQQWMLWTASSSDASEILCPNELCAKFIMIVEYSKMNEAGEDSLTAMHVRMYIFRMIWNFYNFYMIDFLNVFFILYL